MENRMSSRPPIKNPDEFIGAAENRKPKINIDELPWQAPYIREDMKKPLTLQLFEPYALKLKFIAKYSTYSQQEFMRAILEPAIDKMVDDIIDNNI